MNASLAGALTFLLLLVTSALSAEPRSPQAGSAERKAIVDALRIPVREELKKDVIFKINRLRVMDGWAFLSGVPLQPGGGEMDYRGTLHEEAIREGAFDGGIFALLRFRDGKWQVARYIIGATDVPYVDWPEEFHAPAKIFD